MEYYQTSAHLSELSVSALPTPTAHLICAAICAGHFSIESMEPSCPCVSVR